MSLQARITIAGLGAGSPSDITIGVWEAIKSSGRVFIRTGKHPVVEWLGKEGISFSTFDHVYERAACFEAVYRQIAESVVEEARRGPVLYAVPGHPLVAEESVRLIIERAERESFQVEILPAVSFLDAMLATLRLNPGPGLQIIDGLRIGENPPHPAVPAVITQVYSRLVASDVKLVLMEIYPPEHPVKVVRAAGITGEERVETVPLFAVDRLDWIDHLTSLYVPETKRMPAAGADGFAAQKAAPFASRAVFKGADEPRDPGRGDDNGMYCRFPLDPLVNILARLRGENGCPWDREQDHRSLKKYLLEEAYEVLEALDEEDMYKICEELGDLLLQIVFHAQIAAEGRRFDINDVVAGISKKMIRRHPHVFGTVAVRDSGEVKLNWERIKAGEKHENADGSLLAGISKALPALMRAARVQEKAALAGFDWPDYMGALEKTREELSELEHALRSLDTAGIERELGDFIFSAVNLSRLLGVDSEAALTGATEKFIRRFANVERKARFAGKDLLQCTLSEMDMWWEEAKKEEEE
ncbi:MAG TPA: nucleoside triphosphate pyrophosphohydrolase [Bacillota bacterium]|nr:nucleoside triphosphate pyrophosphohydrolase [Bacillota bacterium]